MIDFRYHLVSIVSIFLALAVGIVLGAGPLQGSIAETLTSEITQLRTDKSTLRDQVGTLQRSVSEGEAYAEATSGRVVSGLVAGRGVALVALPGVGNSDVVKVSEIVVAAGGTVASTTKVLSTWVASDGPTRTARADVAAAQATGLRVPTTTIGTDPTRLEDRVLAAALTSGGNIGVGQEAARTALQELVDEKLIETDAKAALAAQLVVVLSAPVTSGSPKDQEAMATEWVRLLTALDDAAAGSVAATFAPAPEPDQGTSIIRTLRADGAAAKIISSVDNAQTPMGRASIILALAEQETGTAGHYGTDEGATAPFANPPKTS